MKHYWKVTLNIHGAKAYIYCYGDEEQVSKYVLRTDYATSYAGVSDRRIEWLRKHEHTDILVAID